MTDRAIRSAWLHLVLPLLFSLAAIWSFALYDVNRSLSAELHEAQQIAVFQAQAFAENARSTIKRIDEIALDLRRYWLGNRPGFADVVQLGQEHTADIVFQVSLIGADGYLRYSNLANTGERLYLGEREHFRAHRQAEGSDRLFISKPLKGKVSGKWSIQFTRPVAARGVFSGVIVISVSPASFVEFSQNNEFYDGNISAMVDDSGSILARHPDHVDHLGEQVMGTPYLAADAPLSGYFRRAAQTDGTERIYGYHRIPEYQLSFIIGRDIHRALAPYREHRQAVMTTAGIISAVVALLIILQFRLRLIRDEMQEQLSDSKSMLCSAVDTIGEAFVIFDRDDRLAYCNEQYRNYYHASADLLVPGRRFEEILRLGAERGSYPEAVGRVDEWVAEKLAAHRLGHLKAIKKAACGRWLRVLDRITPEGFRVGFRIDITELYEAKNIAESASRAKSEFLANMSHEIRTPMNAMLGMAQILQTPELPEEERLSCAHTIILSGQNLLSLLNDVLDISKIEAGKIELQAVEFSPAQLVRETVELFSAPAYLKKLTIVTDSSSVAECHFLGDPCRLRQMLSNLIGNAVKFSAKGRIHVAVRLMEEGGHQLLEFAVSDSGIGIHDDDISRLFKSFSQVDSSVTRHYGGTGLGLSIVRTLARLMGGDAGLTSELGRGSRFWFRVAVESLAAGSAREEGACRPDGGETGNGARLSGRVLVVDDNRIDQKVLGAALAKQGLTAFFVENGQQAVDVISSAEEFDLILMDISMPELDGYAATARIRLWQAENRRVACPIVAITADAYEETRRRCIAAGMNDFLAKPVSFAELGRLLGKWLPRALVLSAPRRAEQPSVAVDMELLQRLIDETVPLLAQRKFDAFARFKAIKSVAANTDLQNEIDAIEQALNAMEFDQVIERLRQLVQFRARSLSA